MKPNFLMSFFYFVYFGLAILLHPVKNHQIVFPNNSCASTMQKEEALIAKETTEILHSELLFKY